MDIKQIIVKKTIVYIFTENPEQDIVKIQKAYQEEEKFDFPLGYEMPILTSYSFLGNKYRCISLWFDNEDVPDFFYDYK